MLKTAPKYFWREGNEAFKRWEIKTAIAYYDKAIALSPDYFEALANKGIALRQLGNLEEAIALIDRALDIKYSQDLALVYEDITERLQGDFKRHRRIGLKGNITAEPRMCYLPLRNPEEHWSKREGIFMGSLYTALAWGSIVDYREYPEDIYESIIEKWLLNKNLETQYESSPWMGFLVADSVGISQVNEPTFCFYYQAFSLSDIEKKVNETNPTLLAEVKRKWIELQAELKAVGIDLPDGEFIVVNDWD